MNYKLIVALVTVFIWSLGASPIVWAEGGNENNSKKDWSIKPTGSVTNYFLYNSRPFFTQPQRSWMETSVVGGAVLDYKDQLTVKGTVLGVKTTGQDPYGNVGNTATVPAFDIDQAFIKYKPFEDSSFSMTLGRQYIQIGDQFIIGDAIYDGVGGATQGTYSAPRKGYDAFRLEGDVAKFHLDAFFLFVDPTWDPDIFVATGTSRDGLFGGLDVTRSFDSIKGDYSLGLYYRGDSNNSANDMGVLDFRFDQEIPVLPGKLYVSGEFVYEHGECNNALYCTTPGSQNLREYAWHGEVGYQATNYKLQPFIELGYAYFSDDYDPIFSAYSGWGEWYMGNQISWINFNTNQKVIRGQVGFSPHETVTMKVMYFNTRLVTGTSGTLSNAFNLATDWSPNDWLWVGLLVGYADARGAVTSNALINPFTGAAAGTSDSIDVGLMTGVWF
jgi:hypothetical protein